jgi:hypothetical protein
MQGSCLTAIAAKSTKDLPTLTTPLLPLPLSGKVVRGRELAPRLTVLKTRLTVGATSQRNEKEGARAELAARGPHLSVT